MPITSTYAGLFALLFVVLSFRVINFRRRGLADANNPEHWRLERAIRGHGNFAEYVPLILLLMALGEFGKAGPLSLHFVGIALLIGRLCHGIAFSTEKGIFQFRTIGTVMTMTALISAGLLNLRMGLFAGS